MTEHASPWDIASLTNQDYKTEILTTEQLNHEIREKENLFISASKEILQEHKRECTADDGLCLSCRVYLMWSVIP